MNPIEEYNLFKNSNLNTVVTPIKKARPIKWLKCWDYKAGLTEYSFKTLMPPPGKHPNIKSEQHDLRPGVPLLFYKVTIKR